MPSAKAYRAAARKSGDLMLKGGAVMSPELKAALFKIFEYPSSLKEFQVVQALLRKEFPDEFRVKTFKELEKK